MKYRYFATYDSIGEDSGICYDRSELDATIDYARRDADCSYFAWERLDRNMEPVGEMRVEKAIRLAKENNIPLIFPVAEDYRYESDIKKEVAREDCDNLFRWVETKDGLLYVWPANWYLHDHAIEIFNLDMDCAGIGKVLGNGVVSWESDSNGVFSMKIGKRAMKPFDERYFDDVINTAILNLSKFDSIPIDIGAELAVEEAMADLGLFSDDETIVALTDAVLHELVSRGAPVANRRRNASVSRFRA